MIYYYRYLFVKMKVVNYSELHFAEVTFYKIHTLIRIFFHNFLPLFQKEGYSKFNKIYEFQCEVNGRPCDMKMTSVSGHLLNHEFETKYRKWYSCAPVQLFDLPVSKHCENESANNIKRTLEKEVRKKII